MLAYLLALSMRSAAEPVQLYERLGCRVIQADLARVRVGVVLAQGFPGTDEAFATMIRRAQPTAAVNGAYFSKDSLLPIGDIALEGRTLHSGRMGTAFMLDEKYKPNIERVVRHRTYAWGAYKVVLACGPALVLDGEVNVDFQGEGFRDPHVTGRAQRMALGYTLDSQLLLVHIRKAVTFAEAGKLMKSLGCHEAMNLDAGASLAMHFRGKTLISPGRKLTNVLALWSRSPG